MSFVDAYFRWLMRRAKARAEGGGICASPSVEQQSNPDEAPLRERTIKAHHKQTTDEETKPHESKGCSIPQIKGPVIPNDFAGP